MRSTVARCSILLLVVTIAACLSPVPPPPELRVTSPQRGMVQSSTGRVTVTGTALPGIDGALISKVTVNRVPATVSPDGSFTATVDLPAGAMLLETVATSVEGGSATDARAVQVGQLRPVGSNIERAVTASLSADAFARLATAAGPLVKATDFTKLLAPLQPMASLGGSSANAKISVTKLTIGDAKFTLTPVDGGLSFSADISGLSVAANVAYGGTFVPDGTTAITITADKLTIAGTLVVTPAGMMGFTTKITSPTVRQTNLRLQASGLVGDILELLDNNLLSTIQDVTTRSAELALQPLVNAAFGALAGPQTFDVLGKKLELQASPAAVTFSRAGALVTMNLQAKIQGSEVSPGYIFTPNGAPTMNIGSGIQLGLADDLVNELLAEVHALGLLDLKLQEDFGLFDQADIKLTLPPMISANNPDGKLRLVLGDMIASIKDQGKPLINAALNASVDLEVLRGDKPEEIALQFGHVQLFVNILDPSSTDPLGSGDIDDAAKAGIKLQLDSLKSFLIKVPVPAVAGVTFDNLALKADSGYVIVSGQVH